MYNKSGWSDEVSPELKPYWSQRMEITIEGECLMWGIRVIIPAKLQDRILEELHQSHSGIARTRSLVRSCMWWPNLAAQIEKLTKSCTTCQAARIAPLHPWIRPSKSWQHINIDFTGPFQGRMFFYYCRCTFSLA